MPYKITKTIKWDMSHKLMDHKGLCKNIHGHSYKAMISLESEKLNEMGMVIDFKDLKNMTDEIVNEWDHATFVWQGDSEFLDYLSKNNYRKVVVPTRNGTAEWMASYIYKQLENKLADDYPCISQRVSISEVTVYETETSCCTYSK